MKKQKEKQKVYESKSKYFAPETVQIDWLDAMSLDTSLIEREDLKDIKPIVASIVGFLVKETDEAYYLAKEFWWSTGQFKYLHVIPKCSVRNIEILTRL